MKKFLMDIFRRGVTQAFHTLWYWSPDTWRRNTFLGHAINQLPMDLWLYQEVIFRERPACILQTGTDGGGLILYFAHLLDLIGAPASALVIGVDIALSLEVRSLSHPRIRLVEGNSVAPESLERVVRFCNGLSPLVVLSSDSRRDHVLRELELYSPLVPPGGHLVVENTNLNGHPVAIGHGPGPFEAVNAFLKVHIDFVRDDDLWERNFFSFHQHGWLVRAMQTQRKTLKEEKMKTVRQFQWVAATKSSAYQVPFGSARALGFHYRREAPKRDNRQT
jgi:cephalosporin hydroxylase